MCFAEERVLRRALRRGYEKGGSRRCLERPLGEHDPLDVCPAVRCPVRRPVLLAKGRSTAPKHPSGPQNQGPFAANWGFKDPLQALVPLLCNVC